MLISQGIPLLMGNKQWQDVEKEIYRAKCVNISKTIGDMSKVTVNDE